MITISEMVNNIEKIEDDSEIETIRKRLNHIYQLLNSMIGENDDYMIELVSQIKKNTDSLISFHY